MLKARRGNLNKVRGKRWGRGSGRTTISKVCLVVLCCLSSTEALHPIVNNKRSQCPFASLFGRNKRSARPPEPLELANRNNLQLQYGTNSTFDVAFAPPLPTAESSLHRLGFGWINRMEVWYNKAIALKCPFFRRRATDLVDSMHELVARFVLHEDLQIPSLRCAGPSCIKEFGLTLEELLSVIRRDWKEATCRGYYVTGKLTQGVYRDDCLFDGPDPDMPVKGLRKYINAASQLFDQRSTRSKLLSIAIEGDVIVARWRFHGTMRLPWRPRIPEVTGTTTYHVDPSGLIYKHIETWDVSAYQAFIRTFFPSIASKLSRDKQLKQ